MVDFEYNNFVNRTTGRNPFDIVLRMQPKKPIDLAPLPRSGHHHSVDAEAFAEHIQQIHADVALRNIRRDAIKCYDKLEKEKKLSEDIVKDLSSDLQKVTDEYIKKVDSIFKQKEKELMTV
ncbi:hypothetical protein AgCh_034808 [Apium graveolens]